MNNNEHNLTVMIEELSEISIEICNYKVNPLFKNSSSVLSIDDISDLLKLMKSGDPLPSCQRLADEVNDFMGTCELLVADLKSETPMFCRLAIDNKRNDLSKTFPVLDYQNIDRFFNTILNISSSLQQRICKSQRFGLFDKYPNETRNNFEVIRILSCELIASMEHLHENSNLFPDGLVNRENIAAKINRINHWKKHAVGRGTLQLKADNEIQTTVIDDESLKNSSI